MYEGNINTVNDVTEFFTHLLEVERLNFHPDEDFANYVPMDSDKPTFSESDIEQYNFLMGRAFEACKEKDIDIYQLAMDCLKQHMS